MTAEHERLVMVEFGSQITYEAFKGVLRHVDGR